MSKAERAQIDLTIKLVAQVRSLLLARVVSSIMVKLLDVLEGPVDRLAREVGGPLARRIGSIAQSWGHVSAVLWKAERSFIRYLAIRFMNEPEFRKCMR